MSEIVKCEYCGSIIPAEYINCRNGKKRKYCKDSPCKSRYLAKKYHKMNKDKIEYKEKQKQASAKYYMENKEKHLAYCKKRYELNKEKILKRNKEYAKNNRNKFCKYNKKYREKNKDKIKDYKYKNKDKIDEYFRKNKSKIAESKHLARFIGTSKVSIQIKQQVALAHLGKRISSFGNAADIDACHIKSIINSIKKGDTHVVYARNPKCSNERSSDRAREKI